MASGQKITILAAKPTKKAATRRQTYRDVLVAPTAKQIADSVSLGKTLSLTEFVKGVKL